MPTPRPYTLPRQAYTVAHFCERYDIGRTKTAELIKAGALDVRRVGRRVLITHDSAEEWWAGTTA